MVRNTFPSAISLAACQVSSRTYLNVFATHATSVDVRGEQRSGAPVYR
jgi:hypothetical protein